MSVPRLNDRIKLQYPTKTRTPSGAEKTGWSVPTPVFAKVEYLGSRAYTAALAEQTGCSVRVVVRTRTLATGWRTLVDGAPFAVKTIEPHKARGFLVLMLEKDDGNG